MREDCSDGQAGVGHANACFGFAESFEVGLEFVVGPDVLLEEVEADCVEYPSYYKGY
jgi:hypothetical protein